MIAKALTSSENQAWETPPALFLDLHRVFNFTLDCAANKANHKVRQYIGENTPRPWSAEGHNALWLNPPYSPRKLQYQIIGEVLENSYRWEIPSVILIPARTDTHVWQDLIFPHTQVYFIRGRLMFVGSDHPAPFPSALCFGGIKPNDPRLAYWRRTTRFEGWMVEKSSPVGLLT